MKLYCLHTDIGPGENCYGDYINLDYVVRIRQCYDSDSEHYPYCLEFTFSDGKRLRASYSSFDVLDEEIEQICKLTNYPEKTKIEGSVSAYTYEC